MTSAGRANNFDLLRLGGALAVLLAHSYALSGRDDPSLHGQTFGSIGVLVFFAISGFLVTRSWDRDPDVVRFALRRVLRIFPALVFVLVVSVAVLGPIATNLSTGAYFRDGQTLRYLLGNLAMWRTEYSLPGVFGDVPYPDVVNGSLWTLRAEVHAYVLVALVGVVGLARNRAAVTAVLSAVLCVMLLQSDRFDVQFGGVQPMYAFIAGALLWHWRNEVPWRWPVTALLLACALVIPPGPLDDLLFGCAVAHGAVLAAYRTPVVAGVLRGYDLSYGLYLWAFPVQQIVVAAWVTVSPLELAAVSLCATTCMALGSWLLIERPALRLARALRRPDGVTDMEAPAVAAATVTASA